MEAYIIKGYRSAVGKANKGGFKNYRSDDLAVEVIKHLMAAVPEVDPKSIDDVIVGCANPEGEQGLQVGRLIAARALGKEVPGITINRYCASGLEAISQAVAKINAGFGHIYLAGGAESMSMIPMTGYKLAPSYKANLENLNYHVGMGATAEAVAAKYGITREAADLFSFESHNKAAAAIDGGKFNYQIVPIEVEEVFVADGKRATKTHTVSMDEGVRRETSLEGLAKLRPAFKVKGVVTAGNASQLSDGASMTLVMSAERAEQLGLEPLAYFRGWTVAGCEPDEMGIGPVFAVPKLLKANGLRTEDIDLVELNEAFASQCLYSRDTLGFDPSIYNVNGGSISIGHPFGMTGSRLTGHIVRELKRRNKKYGIVSMCIGGGMGAAGLFEAC